MMNRIVSFILALILMLSFCSCNQEEPPLEEASPVQNDLSSEEVRIVQRKIDKALESSPSYKDLIEIRDLYNDLLIDEQELIQDYNKIEELFALSDTDVAAIYSVNELKTQLKNPSSLELISAGAVYSDTTVIVKLEYSAANDIGGNIDDEFYCEVEIPTYDVETDLWYCQLDIDYVVWHLSELLSGPSPNSLQKQLSEEYEDGVEISIDPDKVMDNISLNIVEPD